MGKEIPQITSKWMEKAFNDFHHAERSLENGDLEWAQLACQQAAEKALKAVLLNQGMGLSKTHELTSLARKIKAPKEIIACCGMLNAFYTASRYPDVEDFIDEGTMLSATRDGLEAAKKVLEWCKKKV